MTNEDILLLIVLGTGLTLISVVLGIGYTADWYHARRLRQKPRR